MGKSFRKPAPITLVRPDGLTIAYRLEFYLGECVWGYEKWNSSPAWRDAQVRIGAAVEGVEPGGSVNLSADDGDKLHEANAAAQIGGIHAPKIRTMQQAIAAMRKTAATVKRAGAAAKRASRR